MGLKAQPLEDNATSHHTSHHSTPHVTPRHTTRHHTASSGARKGRGAPALSAAAAPPPPAPRPPPSRPRGSAASRVPRGRRDGASMVSQGAPRAGVEEEMVPWSGRGDEATPIARYALKGALSTRHDTIGATLSGLTRRMSVLPRGSLACAAGERNRSLPHTAGVAGLHEA
jgi:hypothetical protein